MMLSKEQVEKFQAIYKKQFEKKISYQDAYESGISLVRMVQLVYKPMTKKEFEMVEKRRKELGITQN